nr:ribokinase [uncultured Oscillibacter sp.]
MKILNFGSLNIDRVYNVSQFVSEGETILAKSLKIFPGGKGLNQSIAAARAGASVIHAGAVGPEGEFLVGFLRSNNVNVENIKRTNEETGHAVIQVNSSGQNSIIVYGGANQLLDDAYIEHILNCGETGDIVLLQNETNSIGKIIRAAHDHGLYIVFNPSPFPRNMENIPIELVDCFMVNEIEGATLAGLSLPIQQELILDSLIKQYPNSSFVLTLGSKGAIYRSNAECCKHNAFGVQAVDTTAAGDTFCGYFLAGLCSKKKTIFQCLQEASAAAAIAVSRAAAAPSIPTYSEVHSFLLSQEHNMEIFE